MTEDEKSTDKNIKNDIDLWDKVKQHITPLSGKNNNYVIEEKFNPFTEYCIKQQTNNTTIHTPHLPLKLKPTQVVLQSLEPLSNHPLLNKKQTFQNQVGKLDSKLFKKHKQFQSVLDLHGHTQASAEKALLAFFDRCQARGYKYVLVITGKGSIEYGSVIKNFTLSWFKLHFEYVVGYSEALAKDGGEGAFYVHIRRIR